MLVCSLGTQIRRGNLRLRAQEEDIQNIVTVKATLVPWAQGDQGRGNDGGRFINSVLVGNGSL